MKDLSIFKSFATQAQDFSARKNAIIYTRVSTKEQADNNTSLATQKKFCERYADQNGFSVLAYFGGTFESAKTDERKEFQRMIKFAQQNKTVGYIIIYSYDRFSRSGANAALLSNNLLKKGIKVIAVTQEVDANTPAGAFQQGLFFFFSQFDNEMRRDKTKTGMSDLLRRGYWLWTPPRGYTNINKHHKAIDWKIEVNKEGELLREAFKWRSKNMFSNAEITRKLQSLGMKIDDRRLQEIFRNPYYCGVLTTKMLPNEAFEGNHEPIVSKEDFLKINNKEFSYHPKEHKCDNENLPLKNFVKCSTCGLPLTGFLVKKKDLYYYRCRTLTCKSVKSAKNLHGDFNDLLKDFQLNPKYISIVKEIMIDAITESTKEDKEMIKLLKSNQTKIQSQLNKIEERYVIGELSNELFQKYSTQFKTEIEQINQQLNQNNVSSSNLEKGIKTALKLSQNLSKTWEVSNLFEKQKLHNLIFPGGIVYDKKNDSVQTNEVNSIFSLIPYISTDLNKIKSGDSIKNDQISARVTP